MWADRAWPVSDLVSLLIHTQVDSPWKAVHLAFVRDRQFHHVAIGQDVGVAHHGTAFRQVLEQRTGDDAHTRFDRLWCVADRVQPALQLAYRNPIDVRAVVGRPGRCG